jgi:2-dehydropantoate 2-reductase
MNNQYCRLLSLLSLLFSCIRPAKAFPITRRGQGRRYSNNDGAEALKATSKKETVAIVGSGAVGAYYGSRLWESGVYDVKFYMRGEHYEKSVLNGLNVTSVHGDMFIPPDVLQAYDDTKDIGHVDWVIVALKSSALGAIPALISPLLAPGKTRVLAIMNGLIEDDLIHQLKTHVGEDVKDPALHCCAALYGGMALVCSNRLGPGRIDHSYAGLLSGGVAACAETTTEEENQAAFEKLFFSTKVETKYERSLLAGRWRKVRCLEQQISIIHSYTFPPRSLTASDSYRIVGTCPSTGYP